MLIYTSIFFITLLYYYLAHSNNKYKDKNWLLTYFLALGTFVGLGDMIGGYDRYVYGQMFDIIADETWSSRNYLDVIDLKQGVEWGYFLWEIIMSFFTTNRYVFIFTTTLLIYILLYKTFKRYINDYPLACIIFIAFFYYFTMTYLREVLAVCIVWQGVHYVWERKPVKFFAILLLAATFHASLLIFAVLYFLPTIKFSKKIILRFMFICFLIGMTPLPMFFISVGIDTTGKGDDYLNQDQGFRIEYVLEVVFILWIIFKNYKKIHKDKKTITFLNMCYALCGILMFFMRFEQGGRFGWPFFLGLFYIFPIVINGRQYIRRLKPIMFTLCFLLFMRLTIGWQPMISPYKTFLTDGIPSGKKIYMGYEYDDHYTINKFYRPAFTFMRKE